MCFSCHVFLVSDVFFLCHVFIRSCVSFVMFLVHVPELGFLNVIERDEVNEVNILVNFLLTLLNLTCDLPFFVCVILLQEFTMSRYE